MKTICDLCFSETPERSLHLDLLLPDQPAPLVVVIHGGGWREGSRKDEGLEWLVEKGFAIARIEYRFSKEAIFPAQLDDCKAALAWLAARSEEFGWPQTPPAVVGTSAGGHLALLLAAERQVLAAVAYCAPCDFIVRSQSQPHLTEKPGGVVYDLLGGSVAENPAKAKNASPAHRVTSKSAPCLLINGTADLQVLSDQPASYLSTAIRAGANVSFLTVPDAEHCGPEYHVDWIRASVLAFLNHHVRTC